MPEPLGYAAPQVDRHQKRWSRVFGIALGVVVVIVLLLIVVAMLLIWWALGQPNAFKGMIGVKYFIA
jgi:hypothetical protein